MTFKFAPFVILVLVTLCAADDLANFPCPGGQSDCAATGQPNMQCVRAANGNSYCGWYGATCSSTEECDRGVCTSDRCEGQTGDSCPGEPDAYTTYDNNASDGCLGKITCSSTNGSPGVCGGVGSQCSSNAVCTSNTCNSQTDQCSLSGSQQARVRRTLRAQARCPAGLTACNYERGRLHAVGCVDLSTSLERCGACDRDCSELEGTDNVSCIAGECLIHSCEEGYILDGGVCVPAPAPSTDRRSRRRVAL